MPVSSDLGPRLQRFTNDLQVDTGAARRRVVRSAHRRRVRNRAGGALVLALLTASAIVTPRMLASTPPGQPGTATTSGSAAGPVPTGSGYVYLPASLPAGVQLTQANEWDAGPPLGRGQFSDVVIGSRRCTDSRCTVLRIRVVRGQPPLDPHRQAPAYAGRVVTIRGRPGLLLPVIGGVRTTSAVIWTEPSGLLVAVDGTDAGTIVAQQELLAVARGLQVPAGTHGPLPKPKVTTPGYERMTDKEEDPSTLTPDDWVPGPLPRALHHSYGVPEAFPPGWLMSWRNELEKQAAKEGREVDRRAYEEALKQKLRTLPVPQRQEYEAWEARDRAAATAAAAAFDVTAYRGMPAPALRKAMAGYGCTRPTKVRGRDAWRLPGSSGRDFPAPADGGTPCAPSESKSLALVWNEHDDVTIKVEVGADAGEGALRRVAESLRPQ
jgi:hypothetical protein